MSDIILPGTASWYDTLRPRRGEFEQFLQKYIGADWWRVPKRLKEELWLIKRPQLNHVLGMRRFRFGSPRYQRGVLHPVGFWFEPGGDPAPALTAITHTVSNVSPTQSWQLYGYDTNGHMEWYAGTGPVGSVVYSTLTTGSDDTNDHTAEWWDANPSTNIGASYDLQYNTVTENGTAGGTIYHYFKNSSAIDRTISTWYLISTVDADRADAANTGAIGMRRGNGTAKSPSPGTSILTVDVDIRATGTGSALATHTLTITNTGT